MPKQMKEVLLMAAAGNVSDDGLGSAVLVHGGWGNPDDWRWVRAILEDAGVHVTTPDLPSHRSTRATLAEDAGEVRAAIRSSSGPVVAVGWSYGGDVIGVAAADEPSVLHLVYVCSVPSLPTTQPRDASWAENDPHILTGDHGAIGLDNEWWFEAEAKRLFSGDLLEHFRHHPRRMASKATATDPLLAAAWQHIPSTVLFGRNDQLITDHDLEWVRSTFDDVRSVDADHFVIFTHPQIVAQVITEVLTKAR